MKNANIMLAGVFGLVALLFAVAFISQMDFVQNPSVQVAAPGELPQGNAASGKRIAEFYCADCHAIAGAGPSPETLAPPFVEMVKRWPVEYLAEALAEGIVVSSHDTVEMPEFVLEPKEIDDLLAYLDGLK